MAKIIEFRQQAAMRRFLAHKPPPEARPARVGGYILFFPDLSKQQIGRMADEPVARTESDDSDDAA